MFHAVFFVITKKQSATLHAAGISSSTFVNKPITIDDKKSWFGNLLRRLRLGRKEGYYYHFFHEAHLELAT
jgi:hypothetical protein